MAIAGHVPLAVSAGEASAAGQATNEHLTGILLACSADESTIRSDILGAVNAADAPAWLPARLSFAEPPVTLLSTFSADKCSALIEQLAANNTRQVPTLSIFRAIAHMDDGNLTSDPRMSLLADHIRRHWQASAARTRAPAKLANAKRFLAKYLELVGALHAGGVDILVGTDTPNPFVYPGWSVHEEMALLVRAGLTPTEVIQQATSGVPKLLGLRDVGTIAVGMHADLVVLDADPIADISNTRRIRAVVLHGSYLAGGALNRRITAAQ